jgi:hypothetical protein
VPLWQVCRHDSVQLYAPAKDLLELRSIGTAPRCTRPIHLISVEIQLAQLKLNMPQLVPSTSQARILCHNDTAADIWPRARMSAAVRYSRGSILHLGAKTLRKTRARVKCRFFYLASPAWTLLWTSERLQWHTVWTMTAHVRCVRNAMSASIISCLVVRTIVRFG